MISRDRLAAHFTAMEQITAESDKPVTSTVPIVFTFISLFIGMTMGASVVIAQYFKAGDVVPL